MDKNNEINEHSKVKLSIYKKYLEAYLSIMALQNIPFKDIFIVDVFAGQGKDKNDNEGSALIAANIINGFNGREQKKSIKLYLNDIKASNCEDLRNNIPEEYKNFVKISNQDANDFIKGFFDKIKEISSSHSLVFIDPFGYSQINKDTYNNIFKKENLDIFIFMPIFHIYRFLKGKQEDERYKPIAAFLENFDITTEIVKSIDSVEVFADRIKASIKNYRNDDLVYSYIINNKENSNKYALFFITKNILGAEKFLESVQKIEEKINLQQELFELILPEEEGFIKLIIDAINPLNNRQIYSVGIKNGFLPRQVNAILKELEDTRKIVIDGISPFKRRKGAFYISHSDYKEKPKITITPQNRLI